MVIHPTNTFELILSIWIKNLAGQLTARPVLMKSD